MSTVSTNALTVAQHSSSIVKPIRDYILTGLGTLFFHLFHSPILKMSPRKLQLDRSLDDTLFFANLLFLDPSLGGVCGTSLARFHVRQFPDPVTESLTFWREVAIYHPNPSWRELAKCNGNPEIASPSSDAYARLIEDPTSLNLQASSSPAVILKNYRDH